MIGRRILYTRHDGGVSVCQPAPECIAWLARGGFWAGRGIDLDEQVARSVAQGRYEWAAARYVRAMRDGGCTTAEAFEIIRDRDCAHLGTACDLIDAADLPERTFRDAWRRGHNGGPIMIDMRIARRVQFARIVAASDDQHERWRASFDGPEPLPLNRGRIIDAIRAAETPEQLRRITFQERVALT